MINFKKMATITLAMAMVLSMEVTSFASISYNINRDNLSTSNSIVENDGNVVYYQDGLKITVNVINDTQYTITVFDEYTGDTATELVDLQNYNNNISSIDNLEIQEGEIFSSPGRPGEPDGSAGWVTQYYGQSSSLDIPADRVHAISILTTCILNLLGINSWNSMAISAVVDNMVSNCLENNISLVFYKTYYQYQTGFDGTPNGKTRDVISFYEDPNYKYYIETVCKYNDGTIE